MNGRNYRITPLVPFLLLLCLLFGLKKNFLGVVDAEKKRDSVLAEGLLNAIDRLPPDERIPIWVFFRDKGMTRPEDVERALRERQNQFSQRALWRRSKTLGERPVLPGDLPIDREYVNGVLSVGCVLRHRSNWLNAISVEATAEAISKIANLPYVKKVQKVAYLGRVEPLRPVDGGKGRYIPAGGGLDYGPSFGQLEQINVPAVHDSGFSGAGVIVLMLDTGYYKDHEALATRNIIAEWDFVFEDGETQNEPEDFPGQHDHGTATWSALGGFSPGNLIGPAYGASFLLAKTEDLASETPAEEDNYVAALEWADSLGADIASASLAYLDFDDPFPDYRYSDLDGNTAVISIAVDEAARRGILVCNAAGNWGPGGGSLWTPADADSMLTCGAVDPSGLIASFSSRGPTFDGRLKPEVVARGLETYAASSYGGYGYYGGTSLSTPLVGGSAALILEAHPEWGPMDVREALMSTASRASIPDNSYGSGLIDVWSAIYEDGIELTPLAFSLNSPQMGDTVLVHGIEFRWSASLDPVGGTVRYKLTVSPDSLFQDSIVVWDLPLNVYTLADTLTEGFYYWKVDAYNDQGFYRESNEIFLFYAADPTLVAGGEPSVGLPKAFALKQNYPNPFNPMTTISFDIPQYEAGDMVGKTHVKLVIYDLRGKKVRTLFDGELTGGRYRFSWDGNDSAGQPLSSGMYLYQLVSGNWSSVRKMVLTK